MNEIKEQQRAISKRNGKKQQKTSEYKYFYTQYVQIKKDWTNILFSISQGDVIKYNELMRMNVFSFWNFYGVWIEDLKSKNSKK